MANADLPPGVTGGTTTTPPRTIWNPAPGDKLVGKLDRIEGTNFSDMAIFPSAFTFHKGWKYERGPALLKLPISTLLEGLIAAEHSGLYVVVDFDSYGEAKGNQSPAKLFKSVTTFAKGSEEEKALREFLHKTYTAARNANAGSAFPNDPQAPLADGDDVPF